MSHQGNAWEKEYRNPKLVTKNDGPNADYLDKTTCEWTLEYGENKFCTIYDYKIYTTPFDDYEWHIGGIDEECIEILKKAIEEGKK